MPVVTIRVHEAGELGGVGGVGPPVGGVEVEVLRAFGELPTDFLFPQPPLVFRGRTNADGEVTFDAVAGRGYPTPQLVTVRLPEGWTSAEQPATDLARWRRAATAERAVIEILGLPDGTVSGPAGAAATMTVRVIRSPGSTVETASSPAVVEPTERVTSAPAVTPPPTRPRPPIELPTGKPSAPELPPAHIIELPPAPAARVASAPAAPPIAPPIASPPVTAPPITPPVAPPAPVAPPPAAPPPAPVVPPPEPAAPSPAPPTTEPEVVEPEVVEPEVVEPIEAEPEVVVPEREAPARPKRVKRVKRRRRLTLLVAALVLVVLAVAGGALVGLASRTSSPTLETAAAVVTIGRFTGGRGDCPGFGPSFEKQYALARLGETIRLYQPIALDAVEGVVAADGTFTMSNALEEYRGVLVGLFGSGSYRVIDPRTRCTETYTFTLTPPEPTTTSSTQVRR